jgi:ribosomal protein L37AE/L43A
MQNGMLQCTNNSCKFTSKQENILWTCSIDKVDFKSKAKVYNPLEVEIARKIINQILIIKHRAHPNKLGCNCKLNIFFTEFLHKKDCNGVLYYGEYNNKIIIVCGKCKAVNFYERFIWTCPKCETRFRDKKGKMIKEKENSLLKSHNEKRFQRGSEGVFGSDDYLKENVRKKNLEAYASPSKKKEFQL